MVPRWNGPAPSTHTKSEQQDKVEIEQDKNCCRIGAPRRHRVGERHIGREPRDDRRERQHDGELSIVGLIFGGVVSKCLQVLSGRA